MRVTMKRGSVNGQPGAQILGLTPDRSLLPGLLAGSLELEAVPAAPMAEGVAPAYLLSGLGPKGSPRFVIALRGDELDELVRRFAAYRAANPL